MAFAVNKVFTKESDGHLMSASRWTIAFRRILGASKTALGMLGCEI